MIHFSSQHVVNESIGILIRKKVYYFLLSMDFDHMRGTRVSTAIGEITKILVNSCQTLYLHITYDEEKKKEIYFIFNPHVWTSPREFAPMYNPFFSKISLEDPNGFMPELNFTVALRRESPDLNEEKIQEIRQQMNEKSREELMGELKHKNDELQSINECMSKFVPSDFLKSLDKVNIQEFELGDAAQKDTTILFTDMRSFSSISEKLTPSELISFINQFLSYVVPVIHEHDGYVLTYLGDAIMTAFPKSVTDAVQCAKKMLEALERMNDDFKDNLSQLVRVGIGINYGSVMIGIIGGEKRMEPTILSDVVNLSSRLETLTKTYGAEILISESAYQKLQEENLQTFTDRFIDEVRVIGKNQPTKIYEIMHEDLPRFAKKIQTKSKLQEIVDNYRNKSWKLARDLIHEVKAINPSDLVLDIYLQRVNELILSYEKLKSWEPIHNWDRKG
ncbi:MAG: adenylate/guanylate cyclase domain-containing protein [Spirochaetota bacterium]